MPPNLEEIKKELSKVSALVAALLLTQKDHNVPTFKNLEKDISTINQTIESVKKSIETLDSATQKSMRESLSVFEEKVQSIKDMIPDLKDGETPSDEKLIALIKPLIPPPKQGDPGEKGDTPVAGVDFPFPQNGISPTDEEIVDLIKPLIPPPAKDGSPDTSEDIRNKLELLDGEERLDVDYIRGVEELIDEKISEIPPQKPQGGGGARQFTSLTDVPNSYTGQAGKVVTVNPTGTGLQFSSISAGGVSLTETEIDFGTFAVPITSWIITDATIDATKKILIFPSPSVATGRLGNDWELDSALFTGVSGAGQFTLKVVSPSVMIGYRKIYYQII